VSTYAATVLWERGQQPFLDKKYSRRHRWSFDGGAVVTASSSPHVVPPPLSLPEAVDPEEAFVAALSSCHLLWFLAIAAERGFRVDRYADEAIGVLERNPEGRLAMTRVTLRPETAFSGAKLPTEEETADMHRRAHDECYIANSVKTDVRCEWRASVPSPGS